MLGPAPGGRAPDRVFSLEAADGVALRAGFWSGGPRLCVILPGRTEYLERVALPAAGFAARGYDVVSLDWRGQGRSARLTEDGRRGHVPAFDHFRRDLTALLRAEGVAGRPVDLLFAHSMGGAIGLRAVAAGLVRPGAMILSAPLFDLRGRGLRRVLLQAMVWWAVRLGLGERWPPVPEPGRPYVARAGVEDNVLTGDPEVLAYLRAAASDPELGLAWPTLGWLHAAFREIRALRRLPPPPCPGLVLLGTAEQVVDAGAVRTGAARLGFRLSEIEGARHEPLIERADLRAEAWAAIDAFLAEALPQT